MGGLASPHRPWFLPLSATANTAAIERKPSSAVGKSEAAGLATAFLARCNHLGKVAIDIGKASGIPSAWPTVTRLARSASGLRLPSAALDHLKPPAKRHVVKLVRLLLRPAQATLLAEHLKGEAMLPAKRDRRGTRAGPPHLRQTSD